MPTEGCYSVDNRPTQAAIIAKLMAKGCTRAQAKKRAWKRF